MTETSPDLTAVTREIFEALRELRAVVDSMNTRIEFVTDDEDAVILRADRVLDSAKHVLRDGGAA